MRTTSILLGIAVGIFASEMLPIDLGLELEIRSEFSNLLPRAGETNFQIFTGDLGGAKADPVIATGDSTRPFSCSSETFTQLSAAIERSCSNQLQACSQAANSAGGGGGGGGNVPENNAVTVKDCDEQKKECLAANQGLGNLRLVDGGSEDLVFC